MGFLKSTAFLPLAPARSGFHPLRLMGQLFSINPESSNALKFTYVQLQTRGVLTELRALFLFCPASVAHIGAKQTWRGKSTLRSDVCIAHAFPCAGVQGRRGEAPPALGLAQVSPAPLLSPQRAAGAVNSKFVIRRFSQYKPTSNRKRSVWKSWIVKIFHRQSLLLRCLFSLFRLSLSRVIKSDSQARF